MPRSKPSGRRSRPNARRSSGERWKTPEPADVLSYAYLWAHEAAGGEESGRKDRPVVVVVATVSDNERTQVFVAPVTHTPPDQPGNAIEIPANVKKHLGLDSARSWVVLTELNRFIWAGPDVRLVAGSESPFYDALPDWLFFRIRDGIVELNRGGRVRVTRRTE